MTAMSESEYRRRCYLPGQIEAARRKLAMLEAEARRYGMTELVEQPKATRQ
ncbi:hypothetical protein [Novosphingobium sp. ST904]|uniref:hypothetical protein n=1 Tax=Novosphingobium sp. ST904 TaxID=1684385 RepID=UPI000A998AFF|nr:hypothetical protein [Novosphingobium sp. ST904]TCM33777.1 hypothetical protein EDF59_11993 [Novosphingobium sp. ST904]